MKNKNKKNLLLVFFFFLCYFLWYSYTIASVGENQNLTNFFLKIKEWFLSKTFLFLAKIQEIINKLPEGSFIKKEINFLMGEFQKEKEEMLLDIKNHLAIKKIYSLFSNFYFLKIKDYFKALMNTILK